MTSMVSIEPSVFRSSRDRHLGRVCVNAVPDELGDAKDGLLRPRDAVDVVLCDLDCECFHLGNPIVEPGSQFVYVSDDYTLVRCFLPPVG